MKKSKFDITTSLDNVSKVVIELAKEKKYREIVNEKAVYRWIEELNLYSEIGLFLPHDDQPL